LRLLLLSLLLSACGSFNYGKVESPPKKIEIEAKGRIEHDITIRCLDNDNTGFCEGIGELDVEETIT